MKKYTLKSGATLIDFIAHSEESALSEAKRLYPFAQFEVHEVSDNRKFNGNTLHYVY